VQQSPDGAAMLGRWVRVVATAGFDGDAGHMEYLHPVWTGMFIR
jgi:hypothetical protein